MLEDKIIDIIINEDNLYLNIKKEFSLDRYEEIFAFLQVHAKGKSFQKIEIDFGSIFFEITDLMENLIEKSYFYRNQQTHVVLTLGKYDLPYRIECLRSLSKLNITNFKINYLKK